MSTFVSSFIQKFHSETYPAIDQEHVGRPATGKTVIINCAYGVDNYSPATSFAVSNASKIALLHPAGSDFSRTKQEIESQYASTEVQVFVIDFSSTESVGVVAHNVRSAFGAWDVFVQIGAGSVPGKATSLAGADSDDWWHIFEVNVKGINLFAKHFMPKARPNATYISLAFEGGHTPALQAKGQSAYAASQSAVLKLNEYLATEHPMLRVFNVQDGTRDLSKNSESTAPTTWALCGDFCVWLLSPDQDFLRGRLVCWNWDIEEMIAKKAEFLVNPFLLVPTIGGLPF